MVEMTTMEVMTTMALMVAAKEARDPRDPRVEAQVEVAPMVMTTITLSLAKTTTVP